MIVNTSPIDINERTLLILKPDTIQRGLIGKIFQRFENKGFKLVATKLIWVNIFILFDDNWIVWFVSWTKNFSHLKSKYKCTTRHQLVVIISHDCLNSWLLVQLSQWYGKVWMLFRLLVKWLDHQVRLVQCQARFALISAWTGYVILYTVQKQSKTQTGKSNCGSKNMNWSHGHQLTSIGFMRRVYYLLYERKHG